MVGIDHDTGQFDRPSDDLFLVLSNRARRAILFHLRQHRMATVSELVDIVTELDAEDVEPTHIHTDLVHRHLPYLVESGLVTHDRGDGTVEGVDVHESVGEWLDLAVRREIRLGDTAEADAADPDTIRLLITDDEPGLPETIAGHIEHAYPNIEVTTATSALEAISALRAEPFDCIVSDYQMPAISGLDFLTAVREEDDDIPFIVFTAKGSEEIASKAIATGVTDYVQKTPRSDQYETLVDRVKRAVGTTSDD